MLANINGIVLGLLMMGVTIIIHAAFMVGGSRALNWGIERHGFPHAELAKARRL